MSLIEKGNYSSSLQMPMQDGKVVQGKTPSIISSDYHQSEIDINKKLYKHYIWMLWIGLGITVVGLGLCIFGIIKAGLISTITGCIQTFITGTIFKTLSVQSEEKERYYQRAFEEKLLDIICNQDPAFAQKQIERFVDRCCPDKK